MCRAWVFRIVKLADELRQTAHELDKRTTYKMPKKKLENNNRKTSQIGHSRNLIQPRNMNLSLF